MSKFLVAVFLLLGMVIIALSAKAGMNKDLLGVFIISLVCGGLIWVFFRTELEKINKEEKKEQYILELEKRLKETNK